MNLQAAFRNVTDRIRETRLFVRDAEFNRLKARAVVADAEARLTIARNAAMADPAAGSNDNARRAYADAQTADERLALGFANDDLRRTECDVIDMSTLLRGYEDERRYLELVAKLAIAGVADAAEGEVEAAEAFAF